MARLFTCGAETGDIEWNGATINVAVSSTVRRTGSYSVRFRNGATSLSNATMRHVFVDDETEIYGRFAIYVPSATAVLAGADGFRVLEFRDSDNGSQLILVYSLGTQAIDLYDGAMSRLAIGNFTIPADTWCVAEFHFVVGASGPFILKINGSTDISYSGDTDTTDVGNVRSVAFRHELVNDVSVTAETFYYLDDIAINDTDGSYENSWPGLGGVFWLKPTADGAQNDWTPSAGSDNYAMVDDVPPDNETTFNQALDSGNIDLYEVDDCPEYIAEVNFVQVAYQAALATSGYNELTDLVRVGTVNYSGTAHTIVPITPSFTYYLGTPYYLNPGSGSAWGTVEVNAMQVGVEITT